MAASDRITKQMEAGKEDVASAGEHLSQLKDDAARVAERAMEAGRAGVEAAREKLEEGKEVMHDVAERVRTRGNDLLAQAQEYIEEKPLQSIAIAAGVGVLMGLLLRGRR